ncbi:MAG: Arylsulfatase [uncultured Thermomicrobiales bacterium]|uniref:Arylsulfatase n=1 Tax=uncultured Thermomicrobiales bacterium TaxID=1645740 RepID=A0A6J4V350_9BACT|nr:MAG: Arylsulfatase [uncultured Thermomicrobiales bacterium]
MSARPNILLFLTDDHGAWALGGYDNGEIRSPALNRLAAEGVRCTEAFTPSPVCSPARACLLTGRTPSQVGIHDWIEERHPEFGDRDWLADEHTLPELLAAAGYHCGLSGKWHLGRSHETPRGYAWCFGLPRWQGGHIEEYTYHLDGAPLTLAGNKTRFITDYALRFLEEAPRDRPFFLTVGYIATHSPYLGQEPDLAALYDDATFADIPPYRPHPWHKNEGFPQGEGFSDHDCRERYRNYYAAVTDIDQGVGRLLGALERDGRLDDTLVVYTADHGCALGHHGFWGKGNSTRPLNMHETSLRVPLIARPPRVTAPGHVVTACVDHYDTFQTLRDYAGVDLGRGPVAGGAYPGRSYRALLDGRAPADWRDTRFGEYGDLRMIRTPDYKLVRRHPAGPDDLFDLRADPGETVNLAGRAAYAAVEAALGDELAAFYRVHEDPRRSGLRVKELPRHNAGAEAWRDGLREARGLQVY